MSLKSSVAISMAVMTFSPCLSPNLGNGPSINYANPIVQTQQVQTTSQFFMGQFSLQPKPKTETDLLFKKGVMIVKIVSKQRKMEWN